MIIVFSCAYIVAVSIFMLSDKPVSIITKIPSRLRSQAVLIPAALSLISTILPFILLGSKILDNGFLIYFIANCLSSIFLASALILLKDMGKPSNLYLFLFIPVAIAICAMLNIINVQYNTRNGFITIFKIGALMAMLFPLYPLFVFSYKMLKIKQAIKSAIIIFTAIIDLITGILFPAHKDAYIAGAYAGMIFLFFIVLFILIGLYPFIRKKNQNNGIPRRTK